MKYSAIFSTIMLSSLLAACGGSASSSSDKPDSLLPPDLVVSSSSSVESSSSSQASVINADLPIYENFEAVDINGFFSADYKALASKSDTQFYFSTSGYPDSTNPDGVPRMLLTDWTSKALWFGNARFTLGQIRLEAGTTTSLDTESWGELDLSKPFNISFCVKDVGGTLSKHFQIYADNNTTSQGSSLLGNKSRLLNESLSNMTPGQRYSVVVDSSLVATEHSFLQFRVESSADLIIDDLVVEYADTPYTGAVPACTADASFVRPVASSSSSSAVSSDASSSASSNETSVSSSNESSVSSSSDSSSSASSDSSSSSSDAGGASSSAASTTSWLPNYTDLQTLVVSDPVNTNANFNATASPVAAAGFNFYSASDGSLRLNNNGSAYSINYNGTSLKDDSSGSPITLIEGTSGQIDPTILNSTGGVSRYVSIPFAGTADPVTVDITFTNSSSSCVNGQIALVDQSGKTWKAVSACVSSTETVVSATIADASVTELYILMTRSGDSGGGIRIWQIDVTK